MHTALKKMPSLTGLYRKALFSQLRRKNADFNNLPTLSVALRHIRLRPRAVRAYQRLCGFTLDPNNVPATYLHNVAFRLQMQLMTDKHWPLPVMGTVHMRNQIFQIANADMGQTLDMHCRLQEFRSSARGCEFCLISEAFQQGNLIWQDISTFMQLNPPTSQPIKTRTRHNLHYANTRTWHLNAATGRNFARISGDANPIHMGLLSARLFGFKRAIAHGMYLKARALAGLLNKIQSERYQLDVQFKKPVYLPGTVRFEYQANPQGYDFQLYDAQDILCLCGKLEESVGNPLRL